MLPANCALFRITLKHPTEFGTNGLNSCSASGQTSRKRSQENQAASWRTE